MKAGPSPTAPDGVHGRSYVAELAASNRVLRKQCEQLQLTIERLERLAYIDGLTGLANRRHFDRALDAEIRRACRTNLPLTLALCDVDDFKRYNDRFGHQSGDDLLEILGGVFLSAIRRAGDVAARYGGDEFALVLPGIGAMEALAFCEQVRKSICSLSFHSMSGERHARSRRASLSIGVTTQYAVTPYAATDLIWAADAALYKAKAAGRNCTRYQAFKAGAATRH